VATPGITFTFPGQGSYSYETLRDIFTSHPQTVPYFHNANEIGTELLGGDFLSLVTAASSEEHDKRLSVCPDLDQIGIFLTEVLIARILLDSGVKPSLLVGHSFGELAALATAGAFSIETGLRIVCERVLALKSMARHGAMAAMSCDVARAKQCIEELRDSVEISVINHPRQTVVSGELSALEALRPIANRQGISVTQLKSKYPYHSSLLAGAVGPYRAALEAHTFMPANIPVYLCMEGMLYSPGSDLAQILSSQFVRALDFKTVVSTLYKSGYRTFIECGFGDIVTKLIGQNLGEKASEVQALPLTSPDVNLREGLLKLFDLGFGEMGSESVAAETSPSIRNPSELLESMSRVVDDMSQMVKTTSRLIGQVAASLQGTEIQDSSRVESGAALDRSTLAEKIPVQQSTQAKTPVPDSEPVRPRTSSANGNNRISDKLLGNQSQQAGFTREECRDVPIAIVSMGCVLPGANDPEQYWSNILEGVSGISNMAETDPTTAQDFLATNPGEQIKIIPDKTYTLLHGSILSVPYDAALLSSTYTKEKFESLTKGQKLLALSLAQTLARLKGHATRPASGKVQCILGATADGSKEYDDVLFLESMEALVGTLEEPESLRRAFTDALEEVTGYKKGDAKQLTQYKIYDGVVEKFLGAGIQTYVVDTACSSSLYAIYLGMKALDDHDADLVVAGGVFAPGPANNTLFAQFRGLTPRESRPFDASADGVIFGDGAGLVILKRLPDALADGDRVLAVIRGVGLSSDGRSPSINVPQVKGQGQAIRSAYEHSGIDMNTVQYVEAHATATIVGDAVEFSALKETMKRDSNSELIQLGSVKALVGHTGWAAGIASVIKICKAFENRIVPRQYNYIEPSQEIDLAHSHFKISVATNAWPDNVGFYPRRAAINGFGFGGTNAHLILEDFDEAYHKTLCSNLKPKKSVGPRLAVVGVGGLFPGADGSVAFEQSPQLLFKRESFHLPAKKMLLPDVTEHMDASQYLAALAAERTFLGLPDNWTRFKGATGVVLGIESKTERGARANERIFADRLRRKFNERNGNGNISSTDQNRILTKLIECIRARNIPSGPYTLPGLMPNVTAGRIANMFDLNGPNIVIDMGDKSLLQSLFIARRLLVHDDCKMVLAGGINASNVSDGREAEVAFLLALTTLETAQEAGLPVISTMSLLEADDGGNSEGEVSEINSTLNYKGARGAPEIIKAIELARAQSSSHSLGIWNNTSEAGRRLVFEPTSLAKKSNSNEAKPQGDSPSTYAYVQGTPIGYYTPKLVASKAEGEEKFLKDRKLLFLIDQPEVWLALESSGALAALDYAVLCPPGVQLENSVPIDLTSDESVRNSLNELAHKEFDTLIAVKTLADQSKNTLLAGNSQDQLIWIDSLFAVCRHNFERIKNNKISVIALQLGAYKNGQLDPYTGLASGFMKSLARELDGPLCRIINTDEVNLYKALRHVEVELGQPESEVEVCYKDGNRHTFTLAQFENLAKDDRPFLDSESVIIATGGARGVTSVLVEDLLKRFGCRVIALGRTDPTSAPESVLRMDEEAFKNYEAQFYKDELARNKGRKITDIKREYLAYRAANEVSQVINRLQTISGKYEYRSVDVTSDKEIDEIVEDVYRKYGRVDLVIHGAGVQVSTAITKKSLPDFRKIIATKLGGLSNIYRACEKHRNGKRIHYHVLTSVFSYMGNDGQPDYGAANEAMNRIASCMNSPEEETYWSTMAWLGWAGIGMTRDSEFAALAASRKLRGVTKEEGQQIFAALIKGTPTTPINVLLAKGEIDYYKVAIQSVSSDARQSETAGAKPKVDFHVIEREISIESAPYLSNHLVDGVPTLPGAYVIAIFGETAQELRPDLKIISFEKAKFHKFIKVYKSRKTRIRVEARIVSENDLETVVKLSILSDFVHSSGVILQKDALQHEILVRMSANALPMITWPDLNGVDGRSSVDPYMMEGSPVCLSGPFNAMKNIIIGGDHRKADFKLANFNHDSSKHLPVMSKVVLMDSLWRFGVIQLGPNNTFPVFVPEACDVMKIYFDFADMDTSKLAGTLTFAGANPWPDGERLHMGPVAAIDADGNALVVVERGVCRRFGEVRNGHTR
jgi:acyl transferase domain-containing protein/NAD(P)-dependent dehydrogenase (short-subunit alcohol dehydrogenase family)